MAELNWIKSSKSSSATACVELAHDGDLVAVRNSHEPVTELRFTKQEMKAFIGGVKDGEFDDFVDD